MKYADLLKRKDKIEAEPQYAVGTKAHKMYLLRRDNIIAMIDAYCKLAVIEAYEKLEVHPAEVVNDFRWIMSDDIVTGFRIGTADYTIPIEQYDWTVYGG